jgi:hypothetical protein
MGLFRPIHEWDRAVALTEEDHLSIVGTQGPRFRYTPRNSYENRVSCLS